MSKRPQKQLESIHEKLRQLVTVNKTRSCACKLKYLLLHKYSELFFFTFPKKWVGRAMGNETFYGDSLSISRHNKKC